MELQEGSLRPKGTNSLVAFPVRGNYSNHQAQLLALYRKREVKLGCATAWLNICEGDLMSFHQVNI